MLFDEFSKSESRVVPESRGLFVAAHSQEVSFGSSSGIGTKLVYMRIKSSRPPYFDILLYTIFNRLTLNLLICFMYLEKKDYFFQNYFLVLWMVRIKWCKPNLIGMPLLVLGGVVLGWALW